MAASDMDGIRDELRKLTPDELELAIKLVAGDKCVHETSIHEASHAVVAVHLDLPFEYVTVRPTVTDTGDIMPGQIQWGRDQIGRATTALFENYALAIIAPQVVLPFIGIERTAEEAEEEFSGDEAALEVFLRYKPDLTRPYLKERVKAMLSPAILLEIQTVADALKDKKALTPEDVKALVLKTANKRTHSEPWTDGNGEFIFAGGEPIVVTGVPDNKE